MWISLSRRNTNVAKCIYTSLAFHFSSQNRTLTTKPLVALHLSDTSLLHQSLQAVVQMGKYGVAGRFLCTLATGTNLLKMAGEQNNFDVVSRSFKKLLAFPESVSSSSCTLVAKAFSEINDDARLLMFVREISDLTFPRNVSVVNKIILAFADCGQIDNALMIFGQMRNFNCEPDLITYNTVIGVLGQCGQIDEMLHVFTLMQEAHISPDIVSFNTILNSLRKVGRLQLILAYFKQIIQRGIQPDLRTYTALIDCFGRSGNVEESLRLLEEMKCRHIRPSIYIYRSLIHNFKKSEKLETATKLLEEMNSSISRLVGPEDFKKRGTSKITVLRTS